MDNTNYIKKHRKGQHLLNKERYEIEVRLKDGWSIYRIAKHLGRPYNTVKNEIKRGMVSLYNGKQHRYKADEGKKVYLEHRRNCRKKYRCLASVRFLQYIIKHNINFDAPPDQFVIKCTHDSGCLTRGIIHACHKDFLNS